MGSNSKVTATTSVELATVEMYRALVRSFPGGAVFVFDSDLRYLLADGAGLSDVGLSKEGLEGKTIWDALPQETVEFIEPMYRDALAGVSHEFEAPFGGRIYTVHSLPLQDEAGHILAGLVVTQDITDRKQAEEANIKSQRLLSEAERLANLGAWEWNIVSDTWTLSEQWQRIHGCYQDHLTTDQLMPLAHPEDAPAVESAFRAALEGDGVYQIRHRIIRQDDGHVRVVYAYGEIVRDGDGRPVVMYGAAQDITEQSQSEDALRESQHQYEGLVNTLDGIVWEGDAQTFEFSFVSQQAERMLGYPVERWTSEPTFWVDHMHPDDREWAPNFCVLATAEKRAHDFEYRMIAADGRVVWLRDIVTVVLENGEPCRLRGLMIDINDRKAAEMALMERETQYRSVFESATDGLFINDLEGDGRLIDFNPAAARMHGYTREEFAHLQPQDFIHPDSQDVFAEYIRTVRNGEDFRGRSMDVCKDGSLIHVEVYGTGFTHQGRPHSLAVVRDITELVEAYQQLEQRVEERTRELHTLLEVSSTVASTLDLEPLLGLILDQLQVSVGYDGAAIHTLHDGTLTPRAYRGPLSHEQAMDGFSTSGLSPIDQEAFRRRAPIIIDDIRADTPLAHDFRRLTGERAETSLGYVRSWMAVPLLFKEQPIGILALDHKRAHYYTSQHADLAMTIANQAAVALENARLFAESRKLAVLDERHRLARDLHDSVTQLLYSLTLFAEAARRAIAGQDLQSGEAYLLRLGETARQSLKEMRLLVFQLGSPALEAQTLKAALESRLDAVEKRAGVDVSLQLEDESGLSVKEREEIYWIANEALNNALKHARADRVVIELCLEDGQHQLSISDNGPGFVVGEIEPGGLGLTNMRERAERIAGQLDIESSPGSGTVVRLRFASGSTSEGDQNG